MRINSSVVGLRGFLPRVRTRTRPVKPMSPNATDGTATFQIVTVRPLRERAIIAFADALRLIRWQGWAMAELTADLRIESMRAEWRSITARPPIDLVRFGMAKAEADDLVDRGLWTSGPSDMLSVLGRQRDELFHSRMIGWLLAPTNRHGLGRRFLTAFLDHLWPDEALLRSGPVIVDLEVTGAGPDKNGRLREARADVVLRGDSLTVVIENKLDAGEGADQCERLYWAWASEPGETRWVFLTPTGRAPVTTTSDEAAAAWRTMSYADMRNVVVFALDDGPATGSVGRATAMQYLWSLTGGRS